MKNKPLFMGHEYDYWAELERNAHRLNLLELIEEISKLRGELSFIKSRINQIVKYYDCDIEKDVYHNTYRMEDQSFKNFSIK